MLRQAQWAHVCGAPRNAWVMNHQAEAHVPRRNWEIIGRLAKRRMAFISFSFGMWQEKRDLILVPDGDPSTGFGKRRGLTLQRYFVRAFDFALFFGLFGLGFFRTRATV